MRDLTVTGVQTCALPISTGLETAEVVHAQQIEASEFGVHARDPPAKAVGLHAPPVVQRIPPALALSREIIRRYPRHHRGQAVIVELEIFALNPDIHAVVRHKYR